MQETWETWVQSLSEGDPLEKGMAIHSRQEPGESHGQRSLVDYSPRGCKELDITEWLSTYAPGTGWQRPIYIFSIISQASRLWENLSSCAGWVLWPQWTSLTESMDRWSLAAHFAEEKLSTLREPVQVIKKVWEKCYRGYRSNWSGRRDTWRLWESEKL